MLKKYLILTILFTLFTNSVYAAGQRGIFLIKDLEIEHFLTELLQPIFVAAGVNPKSIHIYIIADPSPNAFVAGGQNIFVHTGLITFANSYEEIAGVLAHELGHIVAGHVSRGEAAYAKSNMLVLLGLAAMLLAAPLLAASNNDSGSLVDVVGFLAYGSQQASFTSAMQYSRGEESQADQLGAEFIASTNYSFNGFLNFMKKLYDKEDKTRYEQDYYLWYSSHPLTLNRIAFIEEYIKQHPRNVTLDSKLQTEFLFSKAKILAYTSTYKQLNDLYQENTPDGLYAKAIYNYNHHDFTKATNTLTSLTKNYQSIYIQELVADIAFDSQQYTQAIQLYKNIAKVEPNDIIFLKLARSYLLQNDIQDAFQTINISLSYNNQNPLAWHIKSLIFGKMQKYPEAKLATAEKHLILHQFDQAKYFAVSALADIKNNPEATMQAKDILSYIKNNQKK